jgi:cadherin EGF LAG seven-pass G-type receptor 1
MFKSGVRWLLGSLIILTLLSPGLSYLLLLGDNLSPGHQVFDASVYKLGERIYSINEERTANFVHHLFHVDSKHGIVQLKKRLRCDGILYPNLFTLYIDSTSNRIRDIDYYSLPLRILITGADCGYSENLNKVYAEEEVERVEEEYDNDHIDDEFNNDSTYDGDADYVHRDKREAAFPLNQTLDVRLLDDDEYEILRDGKQSNRLDSIFRNKREVFDDEQYYNFEMAHARKIRRRRNYSFDMAIHMKLSVAKQWIAETYASFSIPTADKWSQICLKQSQYINSLTAFLPRTIQKHCKVAFLDVDDMRFSIESTQGDLVASDDVCIQEQLWKVTVLFSYKCDKPELVDTEHRLKIVYHHQVFNDTDIAKRVRRELRNQSPFFEQALYVASVAEEQEPGALVTTVRARYFIILIILVK